MSEVVRPAGEALIQKAQVLLDGATQVRRDIMGAAQSEISDPQELHSLLVKTRAATDQLELALVYALSLSRNADSQLALAKAMVEEAELDALGKVKGTDFASAREKSVEFNLRTLDERRAEREALEVSQQTRHVVEVLRLLHRGVDSTRRDIEVRLRAVTLTTALERG